jgi:hypothetical protein
VLKGVEKQDRQNPAFTLLSLQLQTLLLRRISAPVNPLAWIPPNQTQSAGLREEEARATLKNPSSQGW